MKKKSTPLPVQPEPSNQEISDYAFHLYQQGKCEQGHDVEHWHEATVCLKANIPRTQLV